MISQRLQELFEYTKTQIETTKPEKTTEESKETTIEKETTKESDQRDYPKRLPGLHRRRLQLRRSLRSSGIF